MHSVQKITKGQRAPLLFCPRASRFLNPALGVNTQRHVVWTFSFQILQPSVANRLVKSQPQMFRIERDINNISVWIQTYFIHNRHPVALNQKNRPDGSWVYPRYLLFIFVSFMMINKWWNANIDLIPITYPPVNNKQWILLKSSALNISAKILQYQFSFH